MSTLFFAVLITWLSSFASASDQPILASRLPIELVGTVIRAKPEKSFAVFHLPKKPTSKSIYYTQSDVAKWARIKAVERERVVVLNHSNKRLEFIRTGPYDPKKAVPPGFTKKLKNLGGDFEFQLKRDEVDKMLGNLGSVLLDAQAVPVMDKAGNIKGFQMASINKGSVFEKLGLSEGDILNEVNGTKLDSLAVVMDLFSQLRDSSLIKVGIERVGKQSALTYLIR